MEKEDSRGFSPYFRELTEIGQNWGTFLGLGLILVLLGAGIIGSAYYATFFSVILFGFFLIAAGIIQIIQSFMARKWSGLFLSLLLGVLYIVTGFLCVTRPETTAIGITFWIAAFCFIAGLFRMLYSAIMRFDQWGWVFFNGLVTFILGILIYSDWPVSGLWVIGLFLGIDMILTGWSWILLSLSAREHVKSQQP